MNIFEQLNYHPLIKFDFQQSTIMQMKLELLVYSVYIKLLSKMMP